MVPFRSTDGASTGTSAPGSLTAAITACVDFCASCRLDRAVEISARRDSEWRSRGRRRISPPSPGNPDRTIGPYFLSTSSLKDCSVKLLPMAWTHSPAWTEIKRLRPGVHASDQTGAGTDGSGSAESVSDPECLRARGGRQDREPQRELGQVINSELGCVFTPDRAARNVERSDGGPVDHDDRDGLLCCCWRGRQGELVGGCDVSAAVVQRQVRVVQLHRLDDEVVDSNRSDDLPQGWRLPRPLDLGVTV